ncbi:STAS domain-containing protein [Actinomadura rudentiformis]|uniref:Anti-sigma factor antagonist n=1 Tax=Actinomadura rudentiformis TaxID=359158 RepID=A0A6H9Z1T6_9ACTN|nr:STAS domain-containing protein [Actinomadura rudentiformis]KAB2347227.1 STAS domain-containing protein [Actinomadura rudentiformis]
MDLTIESRFHPVHTGLAIVTLAGELDVSTATALRERLAALLGEGAHHLILDFTGVRFTDSHGLGVLAGVYQLLRATGQAGPDGRIHQVGTLTLAAPNQRIRDVLRVTGFSRLFPIYSTAELAIIAHTNLAYVSGSPARTAQTGSAPEGR